ncbi:MAG: OsmC family protein [Synechococcus sp. SB0678_bin_12]|nr:OsmC family protein [Synechococcus sp. SB0678_bin_12]MYI87669.1 OsmC family protein [Synechococcus sp. SB0672_bin_10]
MSTVIICRYLGDLQTEARHEGSATHLRTDAPLDNNGKARTFSPTDLLATALGTCLLTIMGITARNHGFVLDPCAADVVKTMSTTPPRRVESLAARVALPRNLGSHHRRLLMQAALHCPVMNSIAPAIKVTMEFVDRLDDGSAEG